MKLSIIPTFLTALLFCIPPNDATAAGAPVNATIRVTIIAMPNAEALQFSAKQDLSGNPAEALAALERLVVEEKATSVANLALTSRSGVNGMTSSGTISLNCTATVSPDKEVADITIVLSNHDHNMTSSVAVSIGEAIFLGSMQRPADKTMTEYFFAKVSAE